MTLLKVLLIFSMIGLSQGFGAIAGAIVRRAFSSVKMNAFDASKTAVVLIEYQNDFTSEGGKLYEAVKPGVISVLIHALLMLE